MAETKEEFVADEQDRTEWDQLWSSTETRSVTRITDLKVNSLFQQDFGPALSATVSKVPVKYIEQLYFPTQDCPFCLKPADDSDTRQAASLTVEFDQINGLGVSVWVHRDCFGELPVSDKPTPIPW